MRHDKVIGLYEILGGISDNILVITKVKHFFYKDLNKILGMSKHTTNLDLFFKKQMLLVKPSCYVVTMSVALKLGTL